MARFDEKTGERLDPEPQAPRQDQPAPQAIAASRRDGKTVSERDRP